MPLALATTTWQISRVGYAGHSTQSSFAFSPSGQASVAFHSSEFHALHFAALDAAGGWDITAVAGSLYGQCYPALKYRLGRPAISYSETNSAISVKAMHYAYFRGANPWEIERVHPGVWSDTSLDFDASRRPHVSFVNEDKCLTHARQALPGVWVSSVVDETANSGGFNSIAIAPSGYPAIAYTAIEGGRDVIKYAAFDGSRWTIGKVADGAGWCSLAFAPSGEPSIVYDSGFSASNVMFAACAGGTWHLEVVAEDAGSPSIACSPTGTLGVTYCQGGGRTVNYAAFIDRQWRHFEVDKAGKDQDGVMSGPFQLTSLGYSRTNDPAVTYYDGATGEIKCAIGTVALMGDSRWRDALGGSTPIIR